MMINQNIAKHSFQAALAVAALMVVQSAWAESPDTIELNSFWAGAGNITVNYSGKTVWYDSTQSVSADYTVDGGAGGFKTYELKDGKHYKAPFETFCVDIFHDFNFIVSSPDAAPTKSPSGLSAAAILNLDRLYTQYGSLIASTSSSGLNETAFQLAIWAIVNDGADINQSGVFEIESGSQPISFENYVGGGTPAGAISLAQEWLNKLKGTTSKYNAEFLMVQNHKCIGKGCPKGAQDVMYFVPSPVPEPQTYAMLLAGLGLVGLIARRRKTLNLV